VVPASPPVSPPPLEPTAADAPPAMLDQACIELAEASTPGEADDASADDAGDVPGGEDDTRRRPRRPSISGERHPRTDLGGRGAVSRLISTTWIAGSGAIRGPAAAWLRWFAMGPRPS
jgi:hypothetical protein